jgi:hypothetical protein
MAYIEGKKDLHKTFSPRCPRASAAARVHGEPADVLVSNRRLLGSTQHVSLRAPMQPDCLCGRILCSPCTLTVGSARRGDTDSPSARLNCGVARTYVLSGWTDFSR